MSEPRNPWLGGLIAGVGSALVAWLVVGLIDAASAGMAALPALLAMWAPPALLVGLGVGLISGGLRSSLGEGAVGAALRRVRGDRELDVTLIGATLAATTVAGFLIIFVRFAALPLVDTKRPEVGAYLLALGVVVAIPVLAALAVPIYQGVTRHVARVIPAIGPMPGVLVLVVLYVVIAFAGANYVIYTQLDWQVLGMGGWYLVLGLVAGTPLLMAIGGGPLAGVLRKLPGQPILVLAGAAVAMALPTLTLSGTPDDEVRDAITDKAMGGSKLLRAYRGLLDADGDKSSPFFGGPDCDDGNAEVYNGAYEAPDGDGVDQNCDGEDRPFSEEEDEDEDEVGATPPTGDGSGGTPAPPKALAQGANVLILMIDTVRADRVGAYGKYTRDGASLTPAIDKFAATAMRFDNAFSQASNTPRAMPAFMTSRYPSMIAVDDLFENYPRIEDDALFVTEVLKDAGLATYGYSSHYYFRPERNFAEQGFTAYDNEGWMSIAKTNKDTASPRIVPKVLAKLDELAASKQQFAMWVHLFDPHATYMEHEEYPITIHRGVPSLMQKYDFEVRYQDDWVAKILDHLDTTKLADNTIVVLVSDHGEAFGVHRFAGQEMLFHGQTLYDELLRIPLLIRVPGQAPGSTPAVVQLIDVAPTILDLLGIPEPDSFLGRSLVPALRGDQLKPRPAYAELIPYKAWDHKARAVVSPDGRWKMFDRISDNKKELYDLSADPEERKDLYRQEQEKAKELEELLLKFSDLHQKEAPSK